MPRCCLLLLAALLTACATPPPSWPPQAHCPEAPAAAGPLLLRLHAGERQQTLQLHRNGDTLVALNGVGAPQFTARGRGSALAVTAEPAYRGPDPQWLLWGLAWWRERQHLGGDCAPQADRPLRQSDGQWEIIERDRVLWRWDPAAPARFAMPARSLEVQVRSREGDH